MMLFPRAGRISLLGQAQVRNDLPQFVGNYLLSGNIDIPSCLC